MGTPVAEGSAVRAAEAVKIEEGLPEAVPHMVPATVRLCVGDALEQGVCVKLPRAERDDEGLPLSLSSAVREAKLLTVGLRVG